MRKLGITIDFLVLKTFQIHSHFFFLLIDILATLLGVVMQGLDRENHVSKMLYVQYSHSCFMPHDKTKP